MGTDQPESVAEKVRVHRLALGAPCCPSDAATSRCVAGGVLSCPHRASLPVVRVRLPRPLGGVRCAAQPLHHCSKGVLPPPPPLPSFTLTPSQRVLKSMLWLTPAHLQLLFSNPGLKASTMQVSQRMCSLRRLLRVTAPRPSLLCCKPLTVLRFRLRGARTKASSKSPASCWPSWGSASAV